MGGRVALEVFRMAPDGWSGWRCSIPAFIRAQPVKKRNARSWSIWRAREGMEALAARWLPPMLHPDHSALLEPLDGDGEALDAGDFCRISRERCSTGPMPARCSLDSMPDAGSLRQRRHLESGVAA